MATLVHCNTREPVGQPFDNGVPDSPIGGNAVKKNNSRVTAASLLDP
jgi:hypothetical protein